MSWRSTLVLAAHFGVALADATGITVSVRIARWSTFEFDRLPVRVVGTTNHVPRHRAVYVRGVTDDDGDSVDDVSCSSR